MSESWMLKTIEREAESRAFSRIIQDPETAGITLYGAPYSVVCAAIKYAEERIGKRIYQMTLADFSHD